jgi:hypothetical protein
MTFLVFFVTFLLAGDAIYEHHKLPHRDPAQSWDQERLKAHDAGCPTSIYIAPKGDLEQC